jgi:hypothetical protein
MELWCHHPCCSAFSPLNREGCCSLVHSPRVSLHSESCPSRPLGDTVEHSHDMWVFPQVGKWTQLKIPCVSFFKKQEKPLTSQLFSPIQLFPSWCNSCFLKNIFLSTGKHESICIMCVCIHTYIYIYIWN